MATKVTFSISAEIVSGATSGILVGDFNSWSFEEGIILKKQKDGSFKASVELEPGTYQYRYFLNDGRWVNDDRASNYVPEYQVENCVVSVETAATKATAKPKTVKAAPTAEAKPKATKKAKATKAEEPTVAKTTATEAEPKVKKVAKKKAS
jgi:1,4-alpha-glucan branching enzyme